MKKKTEKMNENLEKFEKENNSININNINGISEENCDKEKKIYFKKSIRRNKKGVKLNRRNIVFSKKIIYKFSNNLI